MNKEFITYEQALALKELGFDQKCVAYYSVDKQQLNLVNGYNSLMFADYVHLANTVKNVPAPLYQQAFRWFREKHNLHSHISLGISDEQDRSEFEYDEYTFVIEGVKELDFNNYGEESFYKTPEEAELECLIKLIEIVEQK